MKVTDIFYFSGTHWDREWYQTFQGFRRRLAIIPVPKQESLEKTNNYFKTPLYRGVLCFIWVLFLT